MLNVANDSDLVEAMYEFLNKLVVSTKLNASFIITLQYHSN